METDIQWDQVAKKKAKSIDEFDLGEIQEVTPEYVVTYDVNEKKMFQIPKRMARSFDGNKIVFGLSESDANSLYVVGKESNQLSNAPHSDKPRKSNNNPPRMQPRVIKESIKKTTRQDIELSHEELVIEQKRLSKPQEINLQDSDSVLIKIPLKSEEIETDKSTGTNGK
ncbi:MAG TPA: DUF2382 domain-containing protein [Nitrososphaeraceae archaeon]|nr:DUF2382 domain-containing protein [Nitrososphaeraceae archaeon]